MLSRVLDRPPGSSESYFTRRIARHTSRRRPHLTVFSLPNSSFLDLPSHQNCPGHESALRRLSFHARRLPPASSFFQFQRVLDPPSLYTLTTTSVSRQQLALLTGPPPSSCLQPSSPSKPRHLLLTTTTHC